MKIPEIKAKNTKNHEMSKAKDKVTGEWRGSQIPKYWKDI